MNDTIKVEIVYALPREQHCIELTLQRGATVRDALQQTTLLATLDLNPEAFLADRVGIFGNKARAETRLRDGDRLELYRPLHLSPTEARRLRAQSRGG